MSLNPLEQLNVVTIGAVVAIYLATYFILRRWLFVPLLGVMERRARRMEAAAVTQAETRALVERAQQEAASIVAAATEAAERLDKDLRDDLLRERAARLLEAGAQAQDLVARGREEVARIRAAEVARLEEELLACSRQALRKMVAEVDDRTLRVIVGRVVAGSEASRP